MQTKNKLPPGPTKDLYLPRVLEREPCETHKVPKGIPCWHVRPTNKSEEYLAAVCNTRAKKAGYFHRVSAQSMHSTRTLIAIKKK